TGSVISRMARRLFLVIEVRQDDEPWIDHSGVLGGRAGSPYGRGGTGNGCPQRGAPWWSARPSSASAFVWSPRLFILTVPDEQVQGPVDAWRHEQYDPAAGVSCNDQKDRQDRSGHGEEGGEQHPPLHCCPLLQRPSHVGHVRSFFLDSGAGRLHSPPQSPDLLGSAYRVGGDLPGTP